MHSPILIFNPADNDHTVLVTYIGRTERLNKSLNMASVEIPPGGYFEVRLLKGYGSISVHDHQPYARAQAATPMHQPIDPAPQTPQQP